MYNTTKDVLLKAQVPEQTRTYKPISHQQLIDVTLDAIHYSGFSLDKELYSCAKDGNVANGRFTINNVADDEMQLQIGWQNSYDKTLSLKFAIGTRIFICENGCVSGNYGSFKKKHNGNVQEFSPVAITEYIKTAAEAFRNLQKERESMKQIEISTRTKAEILGRMFVEERIIQSTQLGIIAREIEDPTFNYNAPNSLWELYQYTTFAMKNIHPSLWMENHIDVHNFFVNESGLLVSNKAKEIELVDSNFTQLEMF